MRTASSTELDLDLTDADLPCERVRAAEPALRRVAEPQQEPLVGAGERLQPLGAAHREDGGLPGEVGRLRVAGTAGVVRLDERTRTEQVGHPGHPRPWPRPWPSPWPWPRVGARLRARGVAVGEQSMGVVEGGPELLPAGQVLEGGRDAALRGSPAVSIGSV